MKRKLWYMILAALGFQTACEEKREVCMYGTPSMDFEVEGRVTDEEGNPIYDIMVDCENGYATNQAYTDRDGHFVLKAQSFPGQVNLRFTDHDGEANGGWYETEIVEIKFTDEEKVGESKHEWHEGTYRRTGIEVALDEVDPDVENREE